MTQYYITLNEEDLHHLFSCNDESLKKVVEQFTNQLLEQQRTEQINAEPYERTEERKGMRNGYKERHLTTRVGTLTLRVPQIRDGIFIKTKEGEQVRPFSAPLATGVNQEGYREILGMKLGNSETEESWSNFFKDLKARGLKGVNMVVSDNL